jgi:hypothetical protein
MGTTACCRQVFVLPKILAKRKIAGGEPLTRATTPPYNHRYIACNIAYQSGKTPPNTEGEMCSGLHGRSSEALTPARTTTFDRREFLKLAGSGLLEVAFLGTVGAAKVFAQTGSSPGASLTAEFAEAAEEYGVPMELLMAMGYVNTRWEMPPPETNAYRIGDPHGWGSYGIMALAQNSFSDTLGEASRLTGIPEEVLKVDRAANIRGGAALLANSSGGYASGDPSDFYGAVAGRGLAAGHDYAAVSGIGGGELYAQQVFGTMRAGAYKTLFSGETVYLPGRVPTPGIGDPSGR